MPLAESGAQIFALEPGKDLASCLSAKTKRHNVKVKIGEFEKYDFGNKTFDAVVFATSFRWIDKKVRAGKAGRLLRPGGFAAVIETHHVAGGTEGFFRDSQNCYKKWDHNPRDGYTLPDSNEINGQDLIKELSLEFRPAHSKGYEWTAIYESVEYESLLGTYSDILTMPRAERDGLVSCIRELIDTR